MMGSRPIYLPYSYYLVCIKNKSYFVGVKPLLRKDLLKTFVGLLTPVTNTGPHQRARLHDASAARLNASMCHSNFWGIVLTSLPGPDGTRNRRHKENTKWIQRRERGGGIADTRRR